MIKLSDSEERILGIIVACENTSRIFFASEFSMYSITYQWASTEATEDKFHRLKLIEYFLWSGGRTIVKPTFLGLWIYFKRTKFGYRLLDENKD